MFTMWDIFSWKDLSSQRARSYYGYNVDYYASQVSRRLDVVFAGGSKLHYCHSKDHKVASLETRGRCPRLSTGICPRKLSPLSRLFCDNILPRPVGGVSIRHYLSWCGWRTLKIHPLDHTLQIHKYKYTPPLVHYKFRAEGNLSHPAE